VSADGVSGLDKVSTDFLATKTMVLLNDTVTHSM
jgi:hypothetical protein